MSAGRSRHYFVADVHLGPKLQDAREREQSFAGWLDSIASNAASLYLLGDIFDFWWEYKYVVPKGYVRVLGRLAQLVDAGVAVHFCKGNHDRWTFGYLKEEIGMQLHDAPFVAQIDNLRFCVGHGSMGACLLEKMFASRFLQQCYGMIHPRWAMSLGHRWSARNRIKHGGPGRFYEEMESLCCFARTFEQKVDYFVFGHLHTPVNIELPSKARLVVLDEWMPRRQYAVFDQRQGAFRVESLSL